MEIYRDRDLMTPTPFKSDNVYAGIPYRVLKDASVEALMPNGGVENFKTVEQFLAAAGDTPQKFDVHPIKTSDAGGQSRQTLPASTKPLDYYSLLLDTIKKTENNSAQLRQLVYERMRFNFKRDFLFGHSTLGLADIVRHVNDFELAVAQIEANATGEPPTRNRTEVEPAVTPFFGEIDVYKPPRPIPPIYATADPALWIDDGYAYRRLKRFNVFKLSPTQWMGVSGLGILLGVILAGSVMWFSRKPPARLEVAGEATKISTPPKQEGTKDQNNLPFPVPTSYGIYALGNNKLTELHPLPIGIPDARIALSAEIKQPSTTEITDNNPAFILFRRDLLNNAPQTVALRVVARVVRETKIVNAKATVTPIDGTWRIRNVARELKVSPVPGQPEMVIARTADNAPLDAGRYALVLNRVGYDFSTAGPEKSLEFCLEGFETSSGTIFNPCRAP